MQELNDKEENVQSQNNHWAQTVLEFNELMELGQADHNTPLQITYKQAYNAHPPTHPCSTIHMNMKIGTGF